MSLVWCLLRRDVLLLMLIWEMDAIYGILAKHGRVDLKHGRVSEAIAVG